MFIALRYFSLSGSPLHNEVGKVIGSIITVTDISGLKNTETDLRHINQELNSFVYKSSHDLKGPLTSIISLTDLASAEVDDEVALRYLDMISQGAMKLQDTLTDLLDTIRIRDGRITTSKINFPEIIDEVLTSLAHNPGYNRLQFSLYVDENISLISDKKILKSIIQNLIDNAIKYQDYKKPHLSIKVNLFALPEKRVKLEISDNGIGIPESEQSKIFDMFYRASFDATGTGLGLYIVNKALERLNGTISLVSKEGKGSTFNLILPSLEQDSIAQKLQEGIKQKAH